MNIQETIENKMDGEDMYFFIVKKKTVKTVAIACLIITAVTVTDIIANIGIINSVTAFLTK